MRRAFVTLLVSLLPLCLWAQNPVPDQTQAVPTENNERTPDGTVAVFKVLVIGRTVKAINFRNRESTSIGFEGTSLLARAEGKAKVESKQGSTRIHAEFKHLTQAATQFGPPSLTYVLWAITPDGRPENLGEVLPNDDGNAEIDAATNLQAFGLIVTAEPYFAVTRPSDMVVAENRVLPDTTGTIEQVDAKFDLLKRGQYTRDVASSSLTPIVIKGQAPLDLFEAENAIRIAKWAGAEEQAAGTLAKAQQDLANAQAFAAGRGDKKSIITDAREAVQIAEDARIIALSKQEALQQAEVKKDAREAQAQAAQAQAQANQAQVQAAQAQDQAAQAQAQAAAEAQAKAEAQAAQQQAQAQASQANAAAADAQQRADMAENQAREMRARLLKQLNTILQTQDTSRGLVVRMSDVLFSTGRYGLTTDAKMALAKIAGVLLAYPGVRLDVDGFTDSTGRDETNQALSDKRAEAVRTFLVAQGVSPDAIKAQGFGDANPIADNSTAAGRRQNRRVDMIVSGSVIGTQVASSAMAANGPH
ncbi:MAG TPA: OmpA family protein [Terriglobia bacterium]|nr:OmpA family protein [Terriglobia bacterium]